MEVKFITNRKKSFEHKTSYTWLKRNKTLPAAIGPDAEVPEPSPDMHATMLSNMMRKG